MATGFEMLGMILITLANTFVSFLIITSTDPWQDTVTNAVPALVTVVFISLLISLSFMSIWGFSCRALLYIYLWDVEDDGKMKENAPQKLKDLME